MHLITAVWIWTSKLQDKSKSFLTKNPNYKLEENVLRKNSNKMIKEWSYKYIVRYITLNILLYRYTIILVLLNIINSKIYFEQDKVTTALITLAESLF